VSLVDYPVEFKANVESSAVDDAIGLLNLEDEDAERRTIYFLEADSGESRLPLYSRGVVLRMRLGDDGENDVTAKLRPCDLSKLPQAWSAPHTGHGWEYRIERDWSGTSHVLSSSLVVDRSNAQVRSVLHHPSSASPFSAEQEHLVHGYTARDFPPKGLKVLGPIRVRKWKTKVGHHKTNCEEWVIDGGPRFLELSGRADDEAAARVDQKDALALYESIGLRIGSVPELKTKRVLDFFAPGD
jgi:hypothetical protein